MRDKQARKNALRETTIREKSVNEMSIPEELNFMSGRNDSRFNSTMKNNSGHWNNSPRDRNNSYHNGRNNSYHCRNSSYSDNRSDRNNSYSDNKSWNPRYNYSNNYDSRRRLNRYRHQARDPKNKVRFEYNIADKDMMSNLRKTVDHLKQYSQANRNSFNKIIPGVTRHRNLEEVHEDTIAEMEIEKVQEILKEDLDLIF